MSLCVKSGQINGKPKPFLNGFFLEENSRRIAVVVAVVRGLSSACWGRLEMRAGLLVQATDQGDPISPFIEGH